LTSLDEIINRCPAAKLSIQLTTQTGASDALKTEIIISVATAGLTKISNVPNREH